MLHPFAAEAMLKENHDRVTPVPPLPDNLVHQCAGMTGNPFIGVGEPKPVVPRFVNGNVASPITIWRVGVRKDPIDARLRQLDGAVRAFAIDQKDLGHMRFEREEAIDGIRFFVAS